MWSWKTWKRSEHAALLGAVCVAGACDRGATPVIGLAAGSARPEVAEVATAELSGWPGGAPAAIRTQGLMRWTGAAGEVQAAGQLVGLPGVVGVAGHADSRSALLAAPIYDEAHIPLVVPTATSRRLRSVSPWVFPLAPDDSAEASFIVQFAVGTLSARSVALLYDNDAYGLGLRDGLRAAFAARGAHLAAEAPIGLVCAPRTAGAGNDASIAFVTRREQRPDVVVIAGRPPDAACIARQVFERLPGIRLIGGDAVEVDSAFLGTLGRAADSLYLVAFWYPGLPDDRSKAFVQAFRRTAGRTPRASEALLYDALLLLAHAVRDGGKSPEAVHSYLAALGTTQPPYEGVTGPIAFNPDRRRPLYMLRVRHGAPVPVNAP